MSNDFMSDKELKENLQQIRQVMQNFVADIIQIKSQLDRCTTEILKEAHIARKNNGTIEALSKIVPTISSLSSAVRNCEQRIHDLFSEMSTIVKERIPIGIEDRLTAIERFMDCLSLYSLIQIPKGPLLERKWVNKEEMLEQFPLEFEKIEEKVVKKKTKKKK